MVSAWMGERLCAFFDTIILPDYNTHIIIVQHTHTRFYVSYMCVVCQKAKPNINGMVKCEREREWESRLVAVHFIKILKYI